MDFKLKQARMDLKLTVEEVAEKLKIRRQYIVAMEEERWEDIPGLAYRSGYLKMYCKFLNIEYKDNNIIDSDYEDIPKQQLVDDINPRDKLILSLIAILILTIFIWYLIYSRLHNDSQIIGHLEEVDHKEYLVDQKEAIKK